MSIFSPAKHIVEFCDKYDLYEYGLFTVVIMPNGFQFVTQDTELANKMIAEHSAQTKHITELGV